MSSTTRRPEEGLMFKVAMLSIALLLQVPAVIAPTLPLIGETFPQQSLAQIEMISTISNFGILLFVLLSGFVIRYLGTYKTILIGISLALVAGLVPVFSENYNVILVSRFLLGGGIGLFNGLSYSLILRIYTGDTQKQLLGFQGAAATLGMTALTFVVGGLVGFGWHTVFWVYLIALIPLVLMLVFGREIGRMADAAEGLDEQPKVKEKTNFGVMRYGMQAFIVFTFFASTQLKITSVLTDTGAGDASVAASLLGVATLVGILVSIAYGSVYKVLKNFTMPVALIGMAVGLLLISVGTSFPMIAAGQILLMATFVLAAPSLFAGAAEVQPEGSDNLTSIVLLAWINIGVFLAPTTLATIQSIFNVYGAGSAQFVLRIGGFIMLALALYLGAKVVMTKK